MLNPEKLLGGLIRSGLRGSGTGRLMTGGAALGVVGVAMEAAEHFMNRAQKTASGGAPPPPPAGRPAVPPPPPAPGKAVPESARGEESEAVLLIRAMIAAANADGVIDARERSTILDKLKSVELNEDEHQFIIHELLEPKGMGDIVATVKTEALARQVYAVSLMAVDVDTVEEKNYLNTLAANLGLDSEAINDIHQQIGIPRV